jgi:FkbH-like protein
MASGQKFRSLIDLLWQRSQEHADKPAYIFLEDGESQRQDLTYEDLYRRASAVAVRLRESAQPGSRVLLLYPSGLDFIAGFFGCLLAGLVAVPAYPPGRSAANSKAKRFHGIVADARPSHILTTSSLESAIAQMDGVRDIHCISTDGLAGISAELLNPPCVREDTLAFLQYTSGSTSSPKGVMVTHGNILHNERMIQQACLQHEHSTLVGWLPLYHDMGLIGNILQPLYVGSTAVLMAPAAFLQQPIRWLRAISEFAAYSSGGPNFAYELCLSRISKEQCAGLDLSSWRLAFSGAERIRPATIERFSETFAPYGFRRKAFFACYGLAEATLIVSGRFDLQSVSHCGETASKSNIGQPPPQLVSCGEPVADTSVAIVDPTTLAPSAPGDMGEIWVQSPSVAVGYWGNSELTERVFRACLPGKAGTFLRTGDLGFLADGELVVTGRLKDLIIIRGQNYHPEDLEYSAAESHPLLRSNPAAAFSVEIDNAEELVIVQGISRFVRDDLPQIAGAIRDSISAQHGVRLHTVLLVDPAGIPRTSSGKVQRHLCRAQFLNGAFRALAQHTLDDAAAAGIEMHATTERDNKALLIEKAVADEVAGVLGLASLDLRVPLTTLGIDSLTAIELEQRILQRLGVNVSAASVLSGVTPDDIICKVMRELERAEPIDQVEIPSHIAAPEGPAVMSFEQERLWFLSSIAPVKSTYNISAAMPVHGPVSIDVLRQALDAVIRRHEMLRARFKGTPLGPRMIVQSECEAQLEIERVAGLRPEDRQEWVARVGGRETENPFDLTRVPLIRFKLFEFDPSDHVLFVCAHHLIADADSFGTIFSEVAVLYKALLAGLEASLDPPGIQVSDFARWERHRTHDSSWLSDIDFWKQYLGGSLPPPLRFEKSEGDRTPPSAQANQHRFSIPQDLTGELHGFARSSCATAFTVLLAVWSVLLSRLSAQEELLIAVPVSGRNWPQLRNLVGSLAYPVLLRCQVASHLRFSDFLSCVRDGFINAFAHQKIGFSQVIEHTRDAHGGQAPVVQVMIGHTKVPTGFRQVSAGIFDDPYMVRATTDLPLFINLLERTEDFQVTISFQESFIDTAAVERLARDFLEALATFVASAERLVGEVSCSLPAIAASNAHPDSTRVCIAANFAPEPLEESLSFWMQELGASWQVQFSPAGPLMAPFVDPTSAFANALPGINILLVQVRGEYLANRSDEDLLLDAIELFQGRSRRPLLVGICPTRGHGADDSTWEERLARISGVHVVGPTEMLSTYPVASIHDEFAGRIANLPFTREFYAALGTLLSRKIRALTDAPYKAIVLDCDNTLWKGVCAEDGSKGIELDLPRRQLQSFIAQQKAAGMLLCLCSKNYEEDVVAVFAEQSSMPLTLADFVATRINWRPKSENLQSLAQELHIGLDSFIFLDDNPLECAQIQAHCPETLAVCLQHPQQIPAILRNVWGFDRMAVTGEDRRKTELYRQDIERRKIARTALTMGQFIEDLALTIEIEPLRAEQIARVSQLSFRVNQFNLTLRRYSEAELRQSCFSGGCECLTVQVRDRFGDYGLAGCILFRIAGRGFFVEAFLLSCRALGRRVECAMLAKLGQLALGRELTEIHIPFRISQRNTPAQEFVKRLGAQLDDNTCESMTVVIAAQKIPELLDRMSSYAGQEARMADELPAGRVAGGKPAGGLVLARIAQQFRDVETVLREIDANKIVSFTEQAGVEADSPPQTATEATVATMWSDVIGVQVTDVCRDFFSLGGDSLQAVKILARIWDTFQVEMSLDSLFAGPLTVRQVSRAVDELRTSSANSISHAAMETRGVMSL